MDKKIKKNMFCKNIFFVIIVILFTSCDPGTGISFENNTDDQIFIEFKTIYDIQVYKTEMLYGRKTLTGFVKKDSGGYFTIIIGNLELNNKEQYKIISCVGTNIISELGYGTIKSVDNIVSAIDTIFQEINVFKYNNGNKELLYDKKYFLNKENIIIESVSFSNYMNIRINKYVEQK